MFNKIGAPAYRKLVISDQQERLYDVVIFVNLLPKDQIERDLQHLIQSEEQFHQVVYSYNKDKHNHDRRVFFGILYYDTSDNGVYDILTKVHKYKTIPWIAVSSKNFDSRIDDNFI